MKGTGTCCGRKTAKNRFVKIKGVMGRAVDFRALKSIIRNIIRNGPKSYLPTLVDYLYPERKYESLKEISREPQKGPEIRALYYNKEQQSFFSFYIFSVYCIY